MKKAVLAAVSVALPLALAIAAGPAVSQEGSVSLRGSSGPASIELKEPKLLLLPTIEYMRQVINPQANAYWEQAGSLEDEEGTRIFGAPETEEQWTAQVQRAAALMEAGNGLHAAGRMRNGRCTDQPQSTCDAVWNYYAQELIDGGAAAMNASRARNAKAAFDAGSLIYDSCYGCHARYIPRPANSRYTAPFPSDDEIRAKGGVIGE